jgi:SH3-like domain-containing protein
MKPSLAIFAIRLLAVLAAAGGFAASAHAVDFKSVGAAPAVLYDAPSERGRKVFVAPRGMPVEIVLTYGEWTKVRDAGGDLSWVESKQLSSKRMVVVTAANAKLRASADEGAPVISTADRGVLLELADPVASGWLKVRHRDGVTGFVKVTEVWGD